MNNSICDVYENLRSETKTFVIQSSRWDRDLPHFYKIEWFVFTCETETLHEQDRDLFWDTAFDLFYLFAILLLRVPKYAMDTLQAIYYLCVAHENDNFERLN